MEDIKMTKEERRVWLAAKLDTQMPATGRATRMAEALDVSHALATGVLKGSLPKTIDTALKICDHYGLDMREWSTGEQRQVFGNAIERQRAKKNISLAREFEATLGFPLGDDQFFLVLEIIEDETKNGDFNVHRKLEKVGKIIRLNQGR
jgi:plasmid maintenance system antidote protein VapI